jgi:hypothetical protein
LERLNGRATLGEHSQHIIAALVLRKSCACVPQLLDAVEAEHELRFCDGEVAIGLQFGVVEGALQFVAACGKLRKSGAEPCKRRVTWSIRCGRCEQLDDLLEFQVDCAGNCEQVSDFGGGICAA